MALQDGAAYFVVSDKYSNDVLSAGDQSASAKNMWFNMFLASQHWDRSDRMQIVIAQRHDDPVWRFYFVKSDAYLSLDDSDTVINEKEFGGTPRNEAGWVVDLLYHDDNDKFVLEDPSRFEPKTMSLTYPFSLPSSPIVSLQSNVTGNFLEASSSTHVRCRSAERSGNENFWKFVHLPSLQGIQSLRDAREDHLALKTDRDELTRDIDDLRAYIQSISSRLTQMLGYLQAGQYQTMWPWYNDLETAVRNFIQRGYRSA
jgi:hypothetical protein